MMAIENPVHYQLPVLEDAISPTELHELLSLINPEPECGPTTRSTSSSETNRSAYSNEERKRRRMISNRESARRSRWRKKKHQEDLGDEINRLKRENRELENRLFVLTHQCHSVERDSDRLLYELVYLQHRLAGLQETLAASTMMMQ